MIGIDRKGQEEGTGISTEEDPVTLTMKTGGEIEMIEEIGRTEEREEAIEIPGIIGTIEEIIEITEITEITGITGITGIIEETTIEVGIDRIDQGGSMLRRERIEVTGNLLNSLSWLKLCLLMRESVLLSR